MQMDMQSDSAVQGTQQLRAAAAAVAAADTRGKHRISADLKRLEQETRFLEVNSLSYFDGFFEVLVSNIC